MKTILVLGGGPGQVELIKAVKNKNFYLILVSPSEKDIGRVYSDYLIARDIKDVKAILEDISVRKLSIDACVSDQSDVGAMSQALISEALGLISNPSLVIERFCNKYKNYEYLNSKSCAYLPKTFYFNQIEHVNSFLKNLDLSSGWIVKPVNSQGSRGVCKLNETNIDVAITNAFLESGGSGILVQKFISGQHYSVEAFVTNQHVEILAISKKSKFTSNENLDQRVLVAPANYYQEADQLCEAHVSIIQDLGLLNGLTHGEYVIDLSGKVYLIEVAARGGGGNISGKIIKFLTGFDPQSFIINSALGMFADYMDSKFQSSKKLALIFFFSPNEKICCNWSDITEKFKELIYFEYSRPLNNLNEVKDSRDRPGYFITTGASLDEIKVSEQRILEHLGLSGNLYSVSGF